MQCLNEFAHIVDSAYLVGRSIPGCRHMLGKLECKAHLLDMVVDRRSRDARLARKGDLAVRY